MSSVSFTRTNGTPTSQKTFTISLWYKKPLVRDQGASSQDGVIFNTAIDGNNRLTCIINQETSPYDQVRLVGINSASSVLDIRTSARLLDVSGWYHIVAKVDTTQATNTDRAKIYINGVEQTLNISTYPSQNTDLNVTGNPFLFSYSGGGNYLEGSVAHYHYCDGYAYDASSFGETDSTSGVWKPKTAPSVSYGTNGFFLKFANSAALGTDSSVNGNDFTPSGTPTQILDTPSNVYCTMNPLDNYFASGTFSQGNNTITTVNTGYPYNTATMGVNKGKWYWECKWSAQPTGTSNQVLVGIAKRVCPNTTTWLGSAAYTYGYQGTGGVHNDNGTITTYTTWSIGDVIGVALDMDNNRIYFSRNGTWQGSSDPANGTNPISISAPDSTTADSGFYFPAFGDGNNSLQETGQFNFGNGTFGTTVISSPNNDGDGEGKFAYSVPTGYYALNTKNLKTYG